jgi:hypothetical protein
VAVHKVNIWHTPMLQPGDLPLDGENPSLVDKTKPDSSEDVKSIPQGEQWSPAFHFPPELVSTHEDDQGMMGSRNLASWCFTTDRPINGREAEKRVREKMVLTPGLSFHCM